MKVNTQGIKYNAQWLAGVAIGFAILRPLGLRFDKQQRCCFWFSTVAANCAADGMLCGKWFPYRMILTNKN